MKNKIVFIIGVLFAANIVYSEYQYCPVSNKDSGYIHNGPLMPRCTENDSPEIWSGSWEDLQAVAKRVKEKFSFETTKHKSRDIVSLKPASKQEMEKHISNGNYQEWNEYIFDSYHESPNVVDALKTEIRKIIPVGMVPMLDVPILLNDVMKVIGGKVVKYTTHRGDEVVYSKADGRIILDEQLGTRNFGDNYDYLGSELFTKFTKQSVNEIIMNNVQLSSLQPLSPLLSKKLNRVIQLVMEFPTHKERDMDPHENDNQYKYAGILFESDSDGRFYIVDGQTGKRMTKKQVEDFPTTFSDMWKDKGLVCVESDAIDIVPPKENRQSAQNASSEVGVGAVKGDIAKTDATSSDESTRKICTCAEPETFFAGVVMLRILFTEVKKPSARYYCRKCGGFRSGKMFDVVRKGNGIATYPAGVLPPDWDGKIYEETELDEHVKNLLSGFDNSTKAIEGR